jgi:hypothetical protein
MLQVNQPFWRYQSCRRPNFPPRASQVRPHSSRMICITVAHLSTQFSYLFWILPWALASAAEMGPTMPLFLGYTVHKGIPPAPRSWSPLRRTPQPSEQSSMSSKSKPCSSTALIRSPTWTSHHRTRGKYHYEYIHRRVARRHYPGESLEQASHRFCPVDDSYGVPYGLIFLRAVRIYGIMSFADSKIILLPFLSPNQPNVLS